MRVLKGLCLLLVLAGFGFVSACDDTIRGVGRDLEETGDAIDDAAE